MMIAASRLRPATPVVLPFAGSVPQLAALVKVDGALEGVVRLALVQADLDPPSHPGVGGPLDHEQGAFDAADLPQGGPPAQPPRPVHALEERRPRVLEAGGGDVRLDRLLGPVVGRDVVAFPPFSCSRSHPRTPCRK